MRRGVTVDIRSGGHQSVAVWAAVSKLAARRDECCAAFACRVVEGGVAMRHPRTIRALANARALSHATDDMLERVKGIRARRPSPSGRVIPEVDGMCRLTDLYIAPGTIAAATNPRELAADIMAGIQESTADAVRQHKLAVQATVWPELPRVPWVRRRR